MANDMANCTAYTMNQSFHQDCILKATDA